MPALSCIVPSPYGLNLRDSLTWEWFTFCIMFTWDPVTSTGWRQLISKVWDMWGVSSCRSSLSDYYLASQSCVDQPKPSTTNKWTYSLSQHDKTHTSSSVRLQTPRVFAKTKTTAAGSYCTQTSRAHPEYKYRLDCYWPALDLTVFRIECPPFNSISSTDTFKGISTLVLLLSFSGFYRFSPIFSTPVF